MRTIYVNGELNRIEDGCGFRPFKRCPLHVYAQQNNYAVSIDRRIPWQPKLLIGSVENPLTAEDVAQVCADIQKICDTCWFGASFKIQRNQH